MTHGTRSTYQRFRCRCLPCAAANAAYSRALYRLKAAGTVTLGSLVDASQAQRLVQGMLTEHFTFAEIARRIGLRCQRLRIHTDRITVKKYLQIRRVYRQSMSDDRGA